MIMDCFVCHAATLEAELEVVEDRGTLYVHCGSCGLADHMSRLELPDWARERRAEPPTS